MRRFMKNAVMVAALGALVGASITIAAPGERESSGGDEDSSKFEQRVDGPRHHAPLGGAFMATVANKLGVSRGKLRSALREVRGQLGPPSRPGSDSGDGKEQREQRCTQMTDALGKELGKSGDDVRSAFKSAALEQLEKAVDRKRLSREQANRIRSRIEGGSCLPPRPAFHGCGPGGRGGPPPPGAVRPGSGDPMGPEGGPPGAF